MKIEIWSDVVCPFCGIGQKRLEDALADFDHRDDVEVVHRSFQLDERYPVGQTQPTTELLKKKYGMSEAQVKANMERIQAMAALDGLSPYILADNLSGNTSLAHQLLAFAADRGLEQEAWQHFYVAYFGEARSIFDIDALVTLGVELGLDGDEVREVLTDGRYRAKVEQDGLEARELGATGVPFIVIDRKFGIAGAQPIEQFRAALRRAWDANPTPLVRLGDDGQSCGPDGCAVP